MTTPDDNALDDLFRKPAAPSTEVSKCIMRDCKKNLQPQRGMSARTRLLLSVLLSIGLFSVLAWVTRSRERIDDSFRSILFGAAGWALVQTAILWIGLAPRGRRFSPKLRLVVAVFTPILFLAYVGFSSPQWVSFGEFSTGGAAHAVGCGFVGMLFSALITGGVFLLWRGTDPLTPGLTGALVGLVGSVAGGLAIGVGCVNQEGWHACFSHGIGALAFTVLGWAAGRRLLAP